MIDIKIEKADDQGPAGPGAVTGDAFFAGARREEILQQLQDAVLSGVTFMVIAGEEGSGKTTLCRQLARRMSPHCRIVYCPQAVDPFPEVLGQIGSQLGVDGVFGPEKAHPEDILTRIIDHLLAERLPLLLIVDEAENILLTTLEQLGVMIDRLKAAGITAHLLFAGRKTFLENCDHLGDGNFRTDDELHCDLPALTEDETADFLRTCIAGQSGEDAANLFSDEVVWDIYSLAKGNLKSTVLLAEEALKGYGAESSFMVLLEGVEEEGRQAVQEDSGRKAARPAKMRTLVGLGGAAMGLLLLLWLLYPSADRRGEGPGGEQAVPVEEVSLLPDQPPASEEGGGAPVALPATEVAASSSSQAVPEESGQGAVSAVNGPTPSGEANPVAPEVPARELESWQPPEERDEPGQAVVPVEAEKAPQIASPAEDRAVEPGPEEAAPGPGGERGPGRAELAEPAVLPKKPEPLLHLRRDLVKVRNSAADRVAEPAGQGVVDQLYASRMQAGAAWKKGGQQQLYTVQLLSLTSKAAEKTLKALLAEKRYRQEAGNFYILEKGSTPKSILVFYGQYPTLEQARLAQRSLPNFLQVHKPFPLSITRAMAEAGY